MSEKAVAQSFADKQAFSEKDVVISRDVVSRRNRPIPTTELRGKGLYDLSNSENMNNQNN